MIILEGADGSGKSTLAEMLKVLFPYYNLTKSPGKCPAENYYERDYWTKELMRFNGVITDRVSAISEYIYGNVIEGESYLTEKEVFDFLVYFFSFPKNILIYCSGYYGETQKAGNQLYMLDSESMEYEKKVSTQIENIRHWYKELFAKFNKLYPYISKGHFIEVHSFSDYMRLFKFVEESQK